MVRGGFAGWCGWGPRSIVIRRQWHAIYHVDVGAGDSDYTWQGIAGVGYHFKNFDGVLAYRYISWSFGDDAVLGDLNLSGVMLGMRFSF